MHLSAEIPAGYLDLLLTAPEARPLYSLTGMLQLLVCSYTVLHAVLSVSFTEGVTKHFVSCRSAILERCLRRLEFDKARDAAAKAQADQLEAERMAMQSIDW